MLIDDMNPKKIEIKNQMESSELERSNSCTKTTTINPLAKMTQPTMKQQQTHEVQCDVCQKPIRDRWIMKLLKSNQTTRRRLLDENNCNNNNNNNGINDQYQDLSHHHQQEILEQVNQQQLELENFNKEENEETNYQFYHESCLKCSVCSRTLQVTCFLNNQAKLLCHRHYYR